MSSRDASRVIRDKKRVGEEDRGATPLESSDGMSRCLTDCLPDPGLLLFAIGDVSMMTSILFVRSLSK